VTARLENEYEKTSKPSWELPFGVDKTLKDISVKKCRDIAY